MKLTFLGTRGEIDARTRRHRMHSALDVSYRGRTVRVDCGLDWLGRIDRPGRPRAIVVTHGHPDHAWGLRDGAPCPVLAPEAAWETLREYPIADGRTLPHREPTNIEGITFEAFPVRHSFRCPAVGYRITAGRASVFYVPDVVYVEDRSAALGGIDLYVGDGSTLTRSFVRRRRGMLTGHAPIRTQLTWCAKEGVPRAVFTHCGTETVTGDERRLGAELRRLARERDTRARFAHDGLELTLP